MRGENTHNGTKQEPLSLPIPQEWVDEIARRAAEMVAQARLVEHEPWLTVQTAAEHMGCGRHRVYALVRQQAIPHEKDGSRLLFRRSDLDSYIRAGGAVREKYPGLRERVGCMRRNRPTSGAAMPQTPRPVAEEVEAPHA